MIFKKMIFVFFIISFLTLFFYNVSIGGWDQCKGCHDGNLAPDAKELKDRYNTAEKLVVAAEKSADSLMKGFKKNEKLLREAAKDIGLK